MVALGVEPEVLADTVEDDHLVVDGVTDGCQHGADEGLVDLEREGHPAVAERVGSDDEDGVDCQCHNRTDAVRHVAEAQEDVEEDGDQGEYD